MRHAVFFTLLCLWAAPALADVSDRSTLAGDDFVWASLTGAGLGLTGAVAGGALGSLLDAPCDKPFHECPPPAFTIAGVYSGLVIGTAAGVDLYGDAKGYDGRFTSALYGAMLGNLASGLPTVLIASAVDDGALGFPLLGAVLIGFPAVGAALGYQLSLPEPSDGPPVVSLVDLRPGAGLRFGVPAVSLGPDGQGGLTGYAPLVLGAF